MSEVTGQSRIKNTTAAMREDPAEPLLALAIGDGFIEEQERAGQAQSHHAYLRSVLRGAGRPVLDDEWLTAATAREVLEAIARSEDERAVEADGMVRPNDDYWPGRAAEHRADAATARALAASL